MTGERAFAQSLPWQTQLMMSVKPFITRNFTYSCQGLLPNLLCYWHQCHLYGCRHHILRPTATLCVDDQQRSNMQFPGDQTCVERGNSAVERRTRSRGNSGLNRFCCHFKTCAFSFYPRRPSTLTCINEYLAIYSGGDNFIWLKDANPIRFAHQEDTQ